MTQTSLFTGKATGPDKVVIRLNSMDLELILTSDLSADPARGFQTVHTTSCGILHAVQGA